ncbi:5-(carboxyamino)imidazole ribonucleotide synthase [Schaalia sp. ZJ1691]|uniref:5-(carboxyamino)imidazole ribonucleotide synthase n=1 Tax=Schaalia sp. ZJ1691 TaxID=2709404 RepID=UPI0013EC5006|nr:5-(carboxyamino)imidazole ribonucleotide synthase [Schaalia sp. ZJ1691]
MDQRKTTRPVVAVIGGGQLARMMQESAIALGVDLRALVESRDGATGQVTVNSIEGTPSDDALVDALVDGADVLTFEHEHIPQSLLTRLAPHIPIEPSAASLLFAQNKLAMRQRLTELGIPCPQWARVTSVDDVRAFGDRVGWPIIVKTPTGGYDGHGVRVVDDASDVAQWLSERSELLAEEKVPFTSEVAALLARSPSGEIRSWPVATTEQVDGVCSVVTAPASGMSDQVVNSAQDIGERIARELGVTGVLAVEMFVVGQGDNQHVLVNELAMRPHNTGHWTIDGAVTSQFEQHLRAVLDLPLGDTAALRPGASTVMVNLLGSSLPDPARALPAALAAGGPRARIHLYGKEVRPGRKLGHVTVIDEDAAAARAAAQRAVACLRGE